MGSKEARQLSRIIVLLFLIMLAMAAFEEGPVSQEVPVGSMAVFRCQHLTADILRWRVNGSFVGRNPPPDITPGTTRDEEDNLVDTLTIVARDVYNGTTTECVAEFDDGTPDETSVPPAVLLVQGVQTTSQIPTTIPTTPAIPTTPGVEEFTLFPTSKNVTLGTVAEFQCRHPTARVIDWIINGDLVQRSSPGIHLATSGDTHTLSITAQSEFNSTEIQCEAFFRDGPSQISDTAVMMIQGPLSSVTNLDRVNSTAISWDPPNSLDLTDVEPDIIYCVEVYDVTDCEKGELLTGDCNVTVTIYSIPYDIWSRRNDMLLEYIVTPRSNVVGSVNGTASLPFKSHPLNFIMNDITLEPQNDNKINYTTELLFNENDLPVPSNYTLLLEPVDGVGSREEIVAITTLDEALLHLYLRVSKLNRARLWRCSIFAYGCSDYSLQLNQPQVFLSTHDIQRVTVTSPQPGELRVDGFFIEDSSASGVLVIATDGSDTSYHFIDRDSDGLNGDTRVLGLPGGEYIVVSVFVVMEDGLPVERVAAMPETLTVENDNAFSPSFLIEYELHNTSTGVCITCTFLENSTATDCVAVVHQRISQLSWGVMNIESSHKFNRSSGTITAYGCVGEFNSGEYQIGVIGGRLVHSEPGTNTDRAETNTIIGVILGSVIVVVLAVIVGVLLVVVIRNWNSLKSHIRKASPNAYEPAPPATSPRARLVHRVLSDGGNHDIIINMASGPPPPLYSTLPFEATTRSTDASVGIEATTTYSTPAEVSNTVNEPVTTDEQVNHRDIKHNEVNGDQYAVVDKSKKQSKSSEDVEGKKKPLVYTTLAAVAPPVRVPPTTDDPVAYSTVQHEKGEKGDQQAVGDKEENGGDGSVGEAGQDTVIYSTPEIECKGVHIPVDDDRVEYAVVKEPKGQTVPTITKELSPAALPPVPVRFTVDNLLQLLHPISSKWKELSVRMSLNEALIDEIYTNNETNEPCLQAALGWYMKNGDLNHQWEEIVTILKKMNECQLADKVYNLHVHPYERSLPGQTQLTPKLIHPRIASNSDSGIGHSDSDSQSSAPLSGSDDEESVPKSGTEPEPVASTPVQQQTTDLEQAPVVHQASDGSTHVRQTNTYENTSVNYLADKQVVGTAADPVRNGNQVVGQDDVTMKSIVSDFWNDVATNRSHESDSDELVEPGVPNEPEEPGYMETLSTHSSTSLHLSRSERARLLRHRRTRSNHESDELWQSQAQAYSLLSESGDQRVVSVGKCENMKVTEGGVPKVIVVNAAVVRMKIRIVINK